MFEKDEDRLDYGAAQAATNIFGNLCFEDLPSESEAAALSGLMLFGSVAVLAAPFIVWQLQHRDG